MNLCKSSKKIFTVKGPNAIDVIFMQFRSSPAGSWPHHCTLNIGVVQSQSMANLVHGNVNKTVRSYPKRSSLAKLIIIVEMYTAILGIESVSENFSFAIKGCIALSFTRDALMTSFSKTAK